MDGRERMVYIRKTPPTLAKWCMGRLTSLGLGLLGCGASEIFPLNSFPINLKEDIQKRTLAHAEITHEHNSDTPGNAVLPIGFGCAVGVLVRVVNVNSGQA